MPDYQFVVPDHVQNEIANAERRDTLTDFVTRAIRRIEPLTDIGALTLFARLSVHLGRGEAACLALAATNGWTIASDEPDGGNSQLLLKAASWHLLSRRYMLGNSRHLVERCSLPAPDRIPYDTYMPKQELIHPVDGDGNQLDASFELETAEHGFSLYYASRGGTVGTPSARNTQYHIGLPLLLQRLKALDAELTDVHLDSAVARKRPVAERRLQLPPTMALPIRLSEVGDVDELRKVISEAAKNVLGTLGRNPKHGNRMRSIRVLFALPTPSGMRLEHISRFLARGDEGQLPTPDPTMLAERVVRLRGRGDARSRPVGNARPPAVALGSQMRYARLPSVVAYVLSRASGRCELCGKMPFVTDTGEPYFEVHHVCQLAHGGPDTIDNAVAVCADCHRELHYGTHRVNKTRLLLERIPELVHYKPEV